MGKTYNWIVSQPIYLDFWMVFLLFFKDFSCLGKYLIFTSVADSLVSLLVSCVTEDVVLLALHLGKVKFGSRHSLVDVLDVVAGGLEVGGSVVGTGHEDLAQEWHYLRTQVFPHLDALCQDRGTCFRPLDTQWVDRESHRPSDFPDNSTSLSSQQLKISLDLITRSSSFLCLLGHRYGPFRPEQDPTPLPAAGPEREALSGVERNLHVAAEGGYPWVLTGRNQKCSLTELQITQAALMGDTRHCFFYFRDYSFQGEEEDEDRYTDKEGQRSLLSVFSKLTEEERHRARELKNRVVDSLQPVRFFRTLQDLGDLVMRDWKGLMEQLYGSLDLQPTCSGLLDSLDRCYHEGAVQALCRWFAPSTQTTAVMEELNTFTASLTHSDTSQSLATSRNSTIKLTGDHDKHDSEGSIFLLCGERGCGKSSLAAWWLQEFRKKNPRIPAIPHFCGISSSSVDIRSVLRHITTELHLAHYGLLCCGCSGTLCSSSGRTGQTDRDPRALNAGGNALLCPDHY
uniref:NACHT domain-containing protein n=2 Tax=Hucho hucho TaxID=62062 RepID=A0A4W5R7D5_9TELE